MSAALLRAVYSGGRWFRYLGASVVALAVDLLAFFTLIHLGFASLTAGAVSYSCGIVVHWLVSSRLVFTGHVAGDPVLRRRQQLQFALSAAVGLFVTQAVISMGDALLLDPRISKLFAVGVSFQLTYLLRSRIVFA